MATALIFGASGITGWSLMRECLVYPTPTTFQRVIALTNRPLHKDVAFVPADERLEIYSGLDLSHKEQVGMQLQSIPGIHLVTHVYFAAYTGHGSSYQELKRANVEILANALLTVMPLCPRLMFWTLQTGGKAYGVEFHDEVDYNPPLKESSPRIPQPHASNIFYYAQYDLMTQAAQGKNWTFCEIRPDAIIGFVPQGNAMNMAQGLGLFLSLYAAVEGRGATVAFPGNEEAWNAPHTDTSQDLLARFHIFASLHKRQDEISRRAFNVADGPPVTWREIWPGVCEYFGLSGVGPSSSAQDQATGAQWVQSHQSDWASYEQQHGLRPGALAATDFDFMTAILNIPFRRDYDLSAAREIGFEEALDHVVAYTVAFDRMREARIIA
ncbi:hypothetical protein B0A49_05021 [Cryomyces minteri]|uniref:PRISE-like Rossmann-fold domain-containing protein n=2 Tax=Cryomyces minteri TaxID=331657 RepID=A0A4U0XB31_9PEZI|nr:hypothetical protein B0A49_05021 [Cryomyces minteri]